MTWRDVIGRRDVLFMTIDALRYDVAEAARTSGQTPHFASLIGAGWEARHTPATFTFAAHQAFFAGFLPTPIAEPRAARPLALAFPGSRSIDRGTVVFEAPSLVSGFAAAGYHTCCIGGTAFFNPATALGGVLPSLFAEAHWSERMGVVEPHSPIHQFTLAAERLAALPGERRMFLFINVAATHAPTIRYVRGARAESAETQAAALAAVDRQLPILTDALRRRGGARAILCSDHGTCFGEDGYDGHRLAHPAVWTVPYAEAEILP